MGNLIECVVAPGRVVYGGSPNAAGTSTQAYEPGAVISVTRGDAASLRASGHLLQADGATFPPATIGPMPPGYADKATR